MLIADWFFNKNFSAFYKLHDLHAVKKAKLLLSKQTKNMLRNISQITAKINYKYQDIRFLEYWDILISFP